MPDDIAPPTTRGLQASLKTRVGPLPAWGWGVALLAGVGGFWLLKRRGQSGLPILSTVGSSGPFSNGGFGGTGSGGASGGTGDGNAPAPPEAPPGTGTGPGLGPGVPEVPYNGQTGGPPYPNGMWNADHTARWINGRWQTATEVWTDVPQNAPPGAPPSTTPYPGPSAGPPIDSPGPSRPPLSGGATSVRYLNIPVDRLNAGEFNIVSTRQFGGGGVVPVQTDWTFWSPTGPGPGPGGQSWQEWVAGEYVPDESVLGVLPRGLSLPGGLQPR